MLYYEKASVNYFLSHEQMFRLIAINNRVEHIYIYIPNNENISILITMVHFLPRIVRINLIILLVVTITNVDCRPVGRGKVGHARVS
jgi:hypothetical protein